MERKQLCVCRKLTNLGCYQVDVENELCIEYSAVCHELDVDSLVIETGFDRVGKNKDLPELNMNNALSKLLSSLCSGGLPHFLAVLIGFFAVRVTGLMLGRG